MPTRSWRRTITPRPRRGNRRFHHSPAEIAGWNKTRKRSTNYEDRSTGMSWTAVLLVIIVIFTFSVELWRLGLNRGNNPLSPQEGCKLRATAIELYLRDRRHSPDPETPYRAAAMTPEWPSTPARRLITSASRIYEQRLRRPSLISRESQPALSNEASKRRRQTKISDCCCGFQPPLDAIEGRMLTKPNPAGGVQFAAARSSPRPATAAATPEQLFHTETVQAPSP